MDREPSIRTNMDAPEEDRSAQEIYLNPHMMNRSKNIENSGNGGWSKIKAANSFGRARSQPIRGESIRKRSNVTFNTKPSAKDSWHDQDRIKVTTESGMAVEVTLKESKSATNVEIRRDRSKTDDDYGDRGDYPVTRHMLYKEAIYTSVHMLGRPSKRFPAKREDICSYAHETFGLKNLKEQDAVIEHVKSEPFPLVIVNTKVRKGEGLQSLTNKRPPNPYCVVAIETDESMDKKEWQQFTAKSPLNKIKKLKQKNGNIQPIAEHRLGQVYEKIPRFIKTTVKNQEVAPVWEQRFQCLALRPSTDVLTAEVWDHVVDDSVQLAIKEYARRASEAQSSHFKKVGEVGDEYAGNKIPPDEFLGKVQLEVFELPCDGLENWFYLEGKTKAQDKEAHGKLRLQLWFVHAYRHGKHYTELVEPTTMLECLWDWILRFEKHKIGSTWDGSIPQEATCFLFQYALQNGISEDTHAVVRWNAYAKHNLDLEGVGVRLHELDGVMERRASMKGSGGSKSNRRGSLGQNNKSKLDESQLEIEDSILTLMKDQIIPIILNHLNETEARVHEAVKSYKQCRDVLSKFDFSPGHSRITWMFENAIRLCILEWYQAIYIQTVQTEDTMKRFELVNLNTEVLKQVNALIQLGFTKWGPLFWLAGETEYMTVVYDELQKMVNHDVEANCWKVLQFYDDNKRLRRILLTEDKDEELLARALFNFYAFTQVFVETQDQIFTNPKEKPCYQNLNDYHRWFRPIIVLWLGFTVVRGSEMVTKCVNIDNASVENIHTQTSTSALDTANVFHQMIHFWEKLRWPDVSENYVILHFIIEVLCYYTVLYAKRKHEKLEREGFFDTVDRFDISDRLCTALNNIEYVKDYLERIPEEIHQDELLHKLEQGCGITKETQAYRNRLKYVFTVTFENVEITFQKILKDVGNRVRPELSNCVQEALETLQGSGRDHMDEALRPILSYLEENIIVLDQSLLSLNFGRMLQLFWNVLCQEISTLAPKFRMRDTDEQVVFFTRILMLLPKLEDYFDGGDAGLTKDELHTPQFQETKQQLKYYTTETQKLIGAYYGARAAEQMNISETQTSYGQLTVRIGYNTGKLTVDIISAANLSQSDDSFNIWQLCKKKVPSNDPFVEIEILPAKNFTNARRSETKQQWKTLNPVFNEKFHWDVTEKECVKENSVIIFTVIDYDYLSKNDFLGEAIVSLSMIPGIAQKPLPQPMHLNLRAPDEWSNPILDILKSRTWDSEAMKFMKHLNSRQVDKL